MSLPLVLANAGVCLTLSGCDRTENSAIAAVRQNLKDPDSPKFGEFDYNERYHRACLTVNAKKSMGGYTGSQQNRLTTVGDGWEYGAPESEIYEVCKEKFANYSW